MKTILITGANSGIGLECVKQFYTTHNVIAVSRNTENLEGIINNNLKIFKCDLTDYTNLAHNFNKIITDFKKIDILINNAGEAFYGDFNDIGHAKNQVQININISAFTSVIEYILPGMQEKNNGTIINISSLADRYPRPNNAVYGATKAYVKSLTESLRAANSENNIRFTCISPAIINTPLLNRVRKEVKELIEVADFVNIIKFIVDQPQHICIRDIVITPTTYQN